MKQNARLVSNLLGFVYPALMSVLAIERPRDGDEERLFTYWTAFGAFTVLDHLSPQILALYPAYFTTKMSLLYWLYSKEGSFMVYRKVLRPLLVKQFSCLGYQ
ncbi:UNVERIFIED_CONTAM: Receptor expression-enhancing protein 5 [Siphonaria sp. JEL0065]|nr:Receptor expression-enhancing protein 5 [Siphonaria sp. JEL0065]